MPLQETSGAASYDGFGGGVAAVPNYIEDVFSTYLYTGNGSTQTITNGIDLSTKGGLVWIKDRTAANSNVLFDTARGANNRLISNLTNAQSTETDAVTSFNTNGFSIGASAVLNTSSNNLASWTFRKQPKFFDVQTFTDSPHQAQTINHSLGATPGMVILKSTSGADNWYVYHTSLGTSSYLTLNATGGTSSFANWITVSSTQITIAASFLSSGASYVMYIFASNAGGFGLTGTDNVISCGSYTGTGVAGAGPVVNLGYEPQFVLVKAASAAAGWLLMDNMRGITSSGSNPLIPNLSAAELSNDSVYGMQLLPNGFQPTPSSTNSNINSNGVTYIYIAIRRGPMKVPTSGTSVFSPQLVGAATGTNVTTGFPIDLQIYKNRDGGSNYTVDRLRGVSTSSAAINYPYLVTEATSAEVSASTRTLNWRNTGFQIPSAENNITNIFWNFRRAPSFFDEVCYTGTGSATTVTHNLGVAPEMIIVKRRNTALNWVVYQQNAIKSGSTAALSYLILNDTAAVNGPWAGYWNSTAPTSSVFSVGTDSWTNASGGTYVAYLFATCAGVSKVGSYTGNGSTQTINCGFTGGARFVLIKRTDSTGDWYVWDTARGIIAANDPHLSLNTTAAEVTTDDTIDTDNTGFIVNQIAATNVNVTSATYIFLAIA